MKAARLHGYDQAPVVEDVGTPAIGPNDVLVRVAAASLNPLDLKLQGGAMHGYFPLTFPYTLGTDFAGTIERVGSSVVDWKAGDAVIGRADPTAGGAVAEFVAAPATHLAAAPKAMPPEEAAGLATTAGTAWQALVELAQLKSGQTVLIHGGAGGVGGMAVQIARSLGARVTATASGEGIEVARQLGADRAIDYAAERFEESLADLDLVLDTVGGDTQARSFGVLRAGGLLLSTVSPPDEALAKAHGVAVAFVFHQTDGARLKQVADLVEAGRLRVMVDRRAPIADLAQAWERQASGHARGKIIVTPA